MGRIGLTETGIKVATSKCADKYCGTMWNIFLSAFIVFNCSLLPVTSEFNEYCLTETFEASCRNDEVIVMEAASFGRMRLGRCVTRNYGFIGCITGVLQQLDNLCSGRHSCKFDVSDPALVRTKPCPQDFSSYLEASYSCIKVSSLPAERCNTAKYHKLHHPTGYIASVVTEETGCGSQQNPWVITAQTGQKINITLFDFGISGNFNTSSNPGPITAGNSNKRTNYPVYCQQYARIEEKDVARSTIVCGGERREKNVYISVTNEVEVHVMNRRTIGQQHYFILKYNVVGCPNINTPPDTYSKREGQKLLVICNHTGETSYLSCDGRKWQGELKNCTQVPGVDMEEMVTGVGLPPIGISIVIIIGVALVVVVYVAVMIVCVMYLQRRRRRLRQAAEKVDSLQGDIQLVKPDGGPNDGAEECVPMLSKSLPLRSNLGCATVGEYTDVQMRNMIQHSQGGATLHHEPIIIESLDPGPLCPDAQASHPACECHALYPRIRQLHPARIRDPIYEPAKKLTKVQCPIVPNGASCYFELDAKELGNTQGNKLPGPDVVSLTAGRRQSAGGPSSSKERNSERDNEANRLREQAL